MNVVLKLLPKKYLIIAILILAFIFGVMFIGVVTTLIGGFDDKQQDITYVSNETYTGTANVSVEVLKHKPLVEKYANKYGVSQYVDIILSLMMQESGGRGNDPMQSAESFCGRVGCITNVETSIDKGVLHFSKVLAKANNDIKLCLQSYNFGGGFIDYVNDRGGKYTKELAIEFSQTMYQKVKHTGIYHCVRPEMIPYQACYGDALYVDAVLKYVSGGAVAVGGNEKTGVEVVDVGRKWIGNSRYIFGGGRNEFDIAAGRFDCSSFVHWAYKQVGIDLGSLQSVTTDTLKQLGKPVSSNNMKPGDLVFFDTYKIDGHVGIYVGDGKFIGAQTSTGVAIADMTTGYWKSTFNGRVRRI